MALKQIGALWRNNKDGKTFFSGNIEYIAGQKVAVMVMPFKAKPGKPISTKNPAYTILLVTEDNEKEKDAESNNVEQEGEYKD